MATSRGQTKTIGRLHSNIFQSDIYAARLTSEECVYRKTIVVEVGVRYRFESGKFLLYYEWKGPFHAFFHATMSRKVKHGVLHDAMLRQIDITSHYSIKVVSLYAPVAYLDKKAYLDENYDYGELTPNEHEQRSSDQSGKDNMWHDKGSKVEGTL